MSDNFKKNLYLAFHFTTERQKRGGGFGATPKLPATVEDTFHGLKIIDIVGRYCGLPDDAYIDKKVHMEFLCNFSKTWTNKTIKGIYQLAWCLNWCGAKDLDKILNWKDRKDICKSRENLYYFFKIARLFRQDIHEICNYKRLSSIVSFSGILFKRWMATFINAATGNKLFDMTQACNWILACRNYDGGFGFLPGSTSYIENTHYALLTLKTLGESLEAPEETIDFVLACQTGTGGFSRRPNAAPFLDATWHGIATLVNLTRQANK